MFLWSELRSVEWTGKRLYSRNLCRCLFDVYGRLHVTALVSLYLLWCVKPVKNTSKSVPKTYNETYLTFSLDTQISNILKLLTIRVPMQVLLLHVSKLATLCGIWNICRGLPGQGLVKIDDGLRLSLKISATQLYWYIMCLKCLYFLYLSTTICVYIYFFFFVYLESAIRVRSIL
jgi:hypothetical protein